MSAQAFTGVIVLRASISFFVLGIICMILGINSIAGLSVDIGKVLLGIFCVLSIISFFMGKSSGKNLASIGLFVILGGTFTSQLQADDSVAKTTKEVVNDAKRATKEVVRVAKDKTCPLVNGKLKCATQKVKHQLQKAGDKIEDAVD